MDSDVNLGFDSDIFSSHKHIILFSFVSKLYVLYFQLYIVVTTTIHLLCNNLQIIRINYFVSKLSS